MSTTCPPLPTALERIVQKFQQITEPKRRYEYLLWFAQRLPPLFDLFPRQWLLQHFSDLAKTGADLSAHRDLLAIAVGSPLFEESP